MGKTIPDRFMPTNNPFCLFYSQPLRNSRSIFNHSETRFSKSTHVATIDVCFLLLLGAAICLAFIKTSSCQFVIQVLFYFRFFFFFFLNSPPNADKLCLQKAQDTHGFY